MKYELFYYEDGHGFHLTLEEENLSTPIENIRIIADIIGMECIDLINFFHERGANFLYDHCFFDNEEDINKTLDELEALLVMGEL